MNCKLPKEVRSFAKNVMAFLAKEDGVEEEEEEVEDDEEEEEEEEEEEDDE